MSRQLRGFPILLAVSLVGFSPAISAQNITGTILGTIVDPSGAAVPGATVTMVNEDTNISTKGSTNQTEHYEIPYLKPGTYRVNVSHSGFETIVQHGVELQVDKVLLLNFNLQIGATSTSVTVSGRGTMVDFENGSLGQVISSKSVRALPVLGRNVFDLVALSPEVQVNPLEYDLSLQKQFSIKESWALLFRAEAYNLLNTPYFLPPGSSLGSSSFGVISSSMGERQVQLALKLVF